MVNTCSVNSNVVKMTRPRVTKKSEPLFKDEKGLYTDEPLFKDEKGLYTGSLQENKNFFIFQMRR